MLGFLTRGEMVVAEPSNSDTQTPLDYLSPKAFIEAARKADPNFRFALVAAGLLAIVIIIANFGVNYMTLIFGAIALVALMVLYLVFSQIKRLRSSSMDWPALVLVWTVMCAVVAIVALLTTSTFFDWPLPFKSWVVHRLRVDPEPRPGPDPVVNDTAPSPLPPSPEPTSCAAADGIGPGEVGWVFYGVEDGKPTSDGRLVPPNGAPMPAFDAIREGDRLEAMDPVRMYDGPSRNSRLLLKVEDGACVKALSGRKLYKRFGSYSGGWVCSQEAGCPHDNTKGPTSRGSGKGTSQNAARKRRVAASPASVAEGAGSQNCTISNTTNTGSITQTCSR